MKLLVYFWSKSKVNSKDFSYKLSFCLVTRSFYSKFMEDNSVKIIDWRMRSPKLSNRVLFKTDYYTFIKFMIQKSWKTTYCWHSNVLFHFNSLILHEFPRLKALKCVKMFCFAYLSITQISKTFRDKLETLEEPKL